MTNGAVSSGLLLLCLLSRRSEGMQCDLSAPHIAQELYWVIRHPLNYQSPSLLKPFGMGVAECGEVDLQRIDTRYVWRIVSLDVVAIRIAMWVLV